MSIEPVRSARVLAVGLVLALFATLPRAQVAPEWSVALDGTVPVGPPLLDAADRVGQALTPPYGAGTDPTLNVYGPSGALIATQALPGGRSRVDVQARGRGGQMLIVGHTEGPTGAISGTWVSRRDAAGNEIATFTVPDAFGYPYAVGDDAAGNVYLLTSVRKLDAATGRAYFAFDLAQFGPSGARAWQREVGRNVPYYWPGAMTVTGAGLPVVLNVPAPGVLTATAYGAQGQVVASRSYGHEVVASAAVGPGGEHVLFTTQGGQLWVVRHDAQFNEVWRASPGLGQASPGGAIDAQGNVVASISTLAGSTVTGTVVAKISPAGALLWAQPFGVPVDGVAPFAGAIATGPDGSVLVAGDEPFAAGGATGSRLLVVRYAADGSERWRSAGIADLTPMQLAWGDNGGAIVLARTASGSTPTLLRYPLSGQPNRPPVAVAAASPNAGAAPLTVQFQGAASSDADGRIVDYAWDLGDGRSAVGVQPVARYAVPGTYSARLTVTDNQGARSTSAPVVITVAVPPPQPVSLVPASRSVPQLSSLQVTVTVSGSAGATVTLRSSNAAIAQVPATVTVPPGASSAAFTVTTGRVFRNTPVLLSATANGRTVSAAITVTR